MMENKKIEQQLLEIHQKLDLLTAQMREQQRRQRELQELKEDLTIIGKDIFQSAVQELDEVAHHFDTTDLLYLLKKLLRNTRNLTKLMDQMESAADFVQDAAPLGKQVLNHLLDTLSELERKGYFDFARELFNILDTIVSSFTINDVKLLRENITAILLTVKNLTQPEMLSSVNNALHFFQKMDVEIEKDISYWQILKAMRDPEMKRGIAFLIQFTKNMVQSNGEPSPTANQK
jgi:uncharacterized protein YjgD (DUF1641 family)